MMGVGAAQQPAIDGPVQNQLAAGRWAAVTQRRLCHRVDELYRGLASQAADSMLECAGYLKSTSEVGAGVGTDRALRNSVGRHQQG